MVFKLAQPIRRSNVTHLTQLAAKTEYNFSLVQIAKRFFGFLDSKTVRFGIFEIAENKLATQKGCVPKH